MLLRTRITLMVFLVSSALIVSLAIEGKWKAGLSQAEMDQARVQGQKSAWTALTHNALQPLDALVRSAARSGTLTAALVAGDLAELSSEIKTIQDASGSKVATASVEIATTDGTQVYGGEAAEAILTRDAVAAASRHAGPMPGLYYTKAGMPVLAVVAPLYSRTGFIGAVGVSILPQSTVKELAAAEGADAILSDLSGAFPSASRAQLPLAHLLSEKAIDDGVILVLHGGRRIQAARTLIHPVVEGGAPAVLISVKDVTESSRRSFWLSVISLGGVLSGAALSLAFLHWYMRRSFRPLYDVIHMLDSLARGERTTKLIEVQSNDEIGRLAETAVDYRKGLDAREQLLKLQQDIDAARAIQQSMLPEVSPIRIEFSLKTCMHPARDVGGDFFDYFDLPDGRFGFVIADVSGKGMGAALFMAVACTVIRSTARLVPDPGECLARVNDLLAANNAQSLFVTVFYGVLSPETGKIVYANGGHNPPYLVGIGGRVSTVTKTQGKLLALFPGEKYATAELTLAQNEFLFLYTDGVTEAQNEAGALFGEERLEKALTNATHASGDYLSDVLNNIVTFVEDAPQADDITCMILRRSPVVAEIPRKQAA